MKELANFAASTPFELNGIANASKLLQAFTGSALSTGEGLRLVGDAAAAVGQPLEAVSMWFGRLYAGLKDGQPLGEPIQNLTQLGLISGEARAKLLALQGQSLDSARVMDVLNSAFGANAGAMARLAATYDGKMSTMKDGWKEVQVALGTPIKDALKPFIDSATAQLQTLVPSARAVGLRIAEILTAAYGVVASGELSGVLSLAFIAATKILAANLIDALTRPWRVFFATGLATWDSIANVFGTSLDTIFLAAKVQMKELLVMAMDFASQLRGGPGASASLQQSLARDQVALHKARQADASAEPSWTSNFKKWFERMPSMYELTKDSSLKDLKQVWGDFMADARKKVSEAGQVAEEGPRAPAADAAASAGKGPGEIYADRLAKIGGFIGGAGGPAVDFARRTATATERLVADLRQLPAQIARNLPSSSGAAWA
jgi:hypothetical protein